MSRLTRNAQAAALTHTGKPRRNGLAVSAAVSAAVVTGAGIASFLTPDFGLLDNAIMFVVVTKLVHSLNFKKTRP